MIGKAKTVTVALVAAVALSAVTATVARAGEFDIFSSPAVLKAQNEAGQDHVFVLSTAIGEFPVTCSSASFEGTTTGLKINEATVTPTYSSCTAFGVAATVQMNGCKYTLTGSLASNTFNLDIVGCTAGKQIQIKTAICTLDIGEQTSDPHLVATNLTGEVTLSATVVELLTLQTGIACPGGSGGSGFSRLGGNTVVKAYKDISGFQVTKHGHQYIELSANQQVVIVST